MTDLKKKLLPPKLAFTSITGSMDAVGFYSSIRISCQRDFDIWYAKLEANIDALLANAVEVYGKQAMSYPEVLSWDVDACQEGTDTHRALLICVERIEKGVSVEEAIKVLAEVISGHGTLLDLTKLADRLEKEGVRKP